MTPRPFLTEAECAEVHSLIESADPNAFMGAYLCRLRRFAKAEPLFQRALSCLNAARAIVRGAS